MNSDTIWQLIRYVLIAAGAFATGKGWATEAQWTAVIGAVSALFPIIWGLYVKWNTTPVLDSVVAKKDLPTTSSATGAEVARPSQA